MTRSAYVIGSPIGHSLSPAMHNAAFAARGIDGAYTAVDVAPEGLVAWVESIRRTNAFGFNVTVPHKELVARLVDESRGDALVAGAVNTVTLDHGVAQNQAKGPARLLGWNTDTVGFRRLLADEAGLSLRGQHVLILGAGGAARAIAVVALQDEAAHLGVANRHIERAERLLTDLNHIRGRAETAYIPLTSSALESELDAATVVINATSVGLRSQESPLDVTLLHRGSTVVDIVYNPLETVLLRGAAKQGARAIGGLGMLVYQAAAAFELWTGMTAPVSVMYAAARATLPNG